MKPALLLFLGSILLGCASAKVSGGELRGLPGDATVNGVATVILDTRESLDSESEWTDAIRRGFEDEAEALGIAGGFIPVLIRITELSEGSQALRFWVGFGAGAGHMSSTVTVSGYGEFQIEGSVSEGVSGGSFESVCEKVGRVAAGFIADSRGK